MSRDYPLPSYALSVWLVGDRLLLGVPPAQGHERPHTLNVPADVIGLQALLHILRERRQFAQASIIGTPAEPVQYDLDEILKALKAGRGPKPTRYTAAGKEEVSLEDLGL